MDNTVAYGAAKTRALTHRFGGKERFKHVGQYILGNTASGVRYAEENVPSVETMGDRYGATVIAMGQDCITGIVNQIDENLLHLDATAANPNGLFKFFNL